MNRRDFFRSSTAAAATLISRQTSPSRSHVMIGGRRVRVVDIHSHAAIPGVMEMMNQRPQANLLVGTDRLRQMDTQGIDVEVLSINPFWYAADRDLARTLIQTQNEK